MTEHVQTPKQDAENQIFGEGVNAAVFRNFYMNNALIAEGVSPISVALANAVSAADLTAAMAVEAGASMETVNALLEKLLDDMKSRAADTYQYYAQQKAEASAVDNASA